MKRHQLISVHLILSTFLLPFLLMMPLSGFLHLWGQKGDAKSEVVFTEAMVVPTDMKEKERFFRDIFNGRSVAPGYSFEYIRESGDTLTFRPSSREHYVAKVKDGVVEISRVRPNLVKSMMELHKGHGPALFRYFEMVFAFGLVLIALSGVWLAVMVPAYRKTLVLSFASGAIFFLGFVLL